MKKVLFAIFLYCCIFTISTAQIIHLDETVYTTWNMSTGTTTTNPFHKFTFTLENDYTVRKTGNTGRHIRPYLQDSPEAIAELNKFKTKRSLATTAGVLAVGYFIVYAAVDLSKSKDDLSDPGTSSGPNMGALFGPTAGLALIDIILAATSNKHMYKAVELHNKRSASGDTRSQTKLIFGKARTSAGLGVAIQF